LSTSTSISPLDWPREHVFKDDARSRVWLARDPDGRRWVIKQFLHHPIRQRLGLWFGLHPGKREKRKHDQLAADGLDVLRIERDGTQNVGLLGCRYWAMTPYVGMSMYHWVLYGLAADQPGNRHVLARQMGTLAGRLLTMGLIHTDHKASNVLLDNNRENHLWLIDGGSVRKRLTAGEAHDMLRLLSDNLHHAAIHALDPVHSIITRTDRLRFWKALCKVWPDAQRVLGDLPRQKQ